MTTPTTNPPQGQHNPDNLESPGEGWSFLTAEQFEAGKLTIAKTHEMEFWHDSYWSCVTNYPLFNKDCTYRIRPKPSPTPAREKVIEELADRWINNLRTDQDLSLRGMLISALSELAVGEESAWRQALDTIAAIVSPATEFKTPSDYVLAVEQYAADVLQTESRLSSLTRELEEARERAADREQWREKCGEYARENEDLIETRRLLREDRDTLSAELLALRGQQEWQPIETAPKDGSRILFYDSMSSGLIFAGWWDEKFDLKYEEGSDEETYIGAWTDDAVESFSYEETCSYEPTHWKPLPRPPLTQTGEEG